MKAALSLDYKFDFKMSFLVMIGSPVGGVDIEEVKIFKFKFSIKVNISII